VTGGRRSREVEYTGNWRRVPFSCSLPASALACRVGIRAFPEREEFRMGFFRRGVWSDPCACARFSKFSERSGPATSHRAQGPRARIMRYRSGHTLQSAHHLSVMLFPETHSPRTEAPRRSPKAREYCFALRESENLFPMYDGYANSGSTCISALDRELMHVRGSLFRAFRQNPSPEGAIAG